METINKKCSFCDEKAEFLKYKYGIYAFYCDKHVPMGKFRKFLSKNVMPILIILANRR